MGSSAGHRENKTNLWKLVWKVDVPPKVRTLVWRLMSNTLPTKARLKERGLVVEGVDTRCDIDKTCQHVFIESDKERRFWAGMGINSQKGIIQWLKRVLNSGIDAEAGYLLCGLCSTMNLYGWTKRMLIEHFIFLLDTTSLNRNLPKYCGRGITHIYKFRM